ncbi:MAG: metalloprotease TldD [Gammaproteobacteria bacterium]
MSDVLTQAAGVLLDPAGIGTADLEAVLGRLHGHAIDWADLYFQRSTSESWVLEDGIVKEAGHGVSQGVGVRALAGERTGFAYTDVIDRQALLDAADAVRAIARQGGSTGAAVPAAVAVPPRYAASDPCTALDAGAKVALLRAVDAEARRLDPCVKQVIASLAGSHGTVLVATSDGTLGADLRPLVRMNVTVTVERNGRRETASAGGGGRVDYGWFTREDRALGYAREAVRQALVNLEAIDAPAGEMTVVLGPGWPGILLHEAIGHGLEGDFNRKRTSAFAGRIGERVASDAVTVVDDGTLAHRRGSLSIDDEGTPTGRTVLIENGILRGYLQDKLNARLMGMAPTGNGRRESFSRRPMPRMTNTFMLAGDREPAEILASVDRGLYALNFGGGQVDITSGKFVFSAAEAYLVEHGRVGPPVKGATLIGHGPDVLTRVAMVGNDLALDGGRGTCGKEGQSVPVGVGLPTVRLDRITIGGTRR